ncbi:hypothetical protein EJB05_20544, partial [Eragrostis curvula]
MILEAQLRATGAGDAGGLPLLQEEVRATGSSLPDYTHACGACSPCSRVMVSFKCSVAEPLPCSHGVPLHVQGQVLPDVDDIEDLEEEDGSAASVGRTAAAFARWQVNQLQVGSVSMMGQSQESGCDQEPIAIRHHDHEAFIAACHDAVRHVSGLALPEHQLLQPELLPLHDLKLVPGTARIRNCLRRARLHAHGRRVVPFALLGNDDDREPLHLVGSAELVAGLVKAGPGERAVVGRRAGGPEEHGLDLVDVGAGDDGVDRDGLDALGHGVGSLEVAEVLHHRVGGDLVAGLHRGVRARPRQEEPRQRQRVGQHQAAAHADGVAPVALEPCQLHAAQNNTSESGRW